MVQQLTYSRGIKVMPSDYCNIPNPSLFITSVTSLGGTPYGGGYSFQCFGGNFINLGIKVGDIVYFTAGGGGTDNGATVLSVIDADTLEVNNYPSGYADEVRIYAGDQNDASKNGCVLLFPTGTTPAGSVITNGGDEIYLDDFGANVNAMLLPIQVKRYKFGGIRESIALW